MPENWLSGPYGVLASSPSIRRSLLATSLLAVLAGYVVLLLVNRVLALQLRHERQVAHIDAASVALQQLHTAALISTTQLSLYLENYATPQQLFWLVSGHESIMPRARMFNDLRLSRDLFDSVQQHLAFDDGPLEFPYRDQRLLASARSLKLGGKSYRLFLVSRITAEVQQEQQLALLLIAFAGVSALFTSALLRVVIYRGLKPLAAFGEDLASIRSSSLRTVRLPQDGKPLELQPIASAFNNLLDRLSDSWEQQRSFVDGVAHELRTPITLIFGHAQSLLRRSPDDQALALIRSEAGRMATLVSDLLDLARQDSGRLVLRSESIIGEDALLTLYERMDPHAAGRLRLGLQAEPQSVLPLLYGFGDPDRLQQCLTTLVDNALQYSPKGSPVELACSSGPAGELVFHVQDRGPGVLAEERERIFERFVRGSAAERSQQRGSGIGLSVVKLLMEAMGGSVRVVDAPGGGADFQLWLPTAKPSVALPSA